jgi:RND family efflux transporter MFP subunit
MTDSSPDPTPPPISASAPSPAPPAASAPRHGLSRVVTLLAVIIVAAAAGGYWYWQNGRSTEPAQAATPPAPPAVTVASPLHQEIVEWDEFTGQFAAVEYVEIRARVSGYLDEIHFTDGQIVNKGDLLFVIDPRPYQIALDSAKAQLGEATARLDLANRQLARAGALRKSDFVAASTYDERAQDVASATAAVETAKAAINAAELDLEFTHVTTPVTGRVGRHEVSLGNLISGGSTGGSIGNTTLLTTIVSLDPIYLNFDVSESDLLAYQRAVAGGRLKSPRDQPIGVFAHLPDEAKWSLEGRLDFLSNQVDRSTGTIRARATFPNPGYLITPGEFGRVRIPASEPYQAILIPDEAIVTDQSRKLVLTVGADGTVVPKVVRPGPKYDPLGLRIVREGLDPSDKIIINGLMRARPGAKVTPTPGTIQPQPQS